MRKPFHLRLCLLVFGLAVQFQGLHAQRPSFTPPATSTCVDQNQHCAFWSSSGECRNNQAWMFPNCPRSCGVCQALPQDEPVVVPFAPTQTQQSEERNKTPDQASTNGANTSPVVTNSEFRLPTVDAQCPRGVQVQEVQTRAVPTAEQYRRVAQQQGCAIPNQPNQCDKNPCFHARYRTPDGSCNHLSDSLKGAAYMPFLRLLNANFEDGMNMMVGTQQTTRPSPRHLTRFLMGSPKSLPTKASSLITAFGQFLMHDLMRNTLVNTCKCDTRGAHCANIPLAPGDQRRNPCISFTRSIPMCGSGKNGRPRLAMNENTPVIDLSQVYASDPTSAARLRAGPFLASSQIRGKPFPPQSGTNIVTGDDRADLFAGMTALHVVFLRLHNKLVSQLQRVNPRWNPDRLYQEARKISGAISQSIIYNQFLPTLLGSKVSLLGDYTGFKELVDPQISHEFASAAARLHGMVQEVYPLVNNNFQTVGQYRFVEAVASTRRLFTSGVDLIVRGLITVPARRAGRLGTSVTELLFGGETDMLAVNVQRARDYGVKNYAAYRELCGLGNFTFENWDEVADINVRKRVSELYQSPDHVDLYVGGLLETPQDGSILGPTLSCLFAEQMKRSRDGDRHFYKADNIFTEKQRQSIDGVTLGRVLCETGESFTRAQRNVFLVDNGAQAIPCGQLPGLNLSLWREPLN